jgi:hypothetical protein
MSKRYKEKGRVIDYRSKINRMILALGKQGFSVACIAKHVNHHLKAAVVSECQVYYRLRQSGILLRDFREGKTPQAQVYIHRVEVKLFAHRGQGKAKTM